MKKTAIAVLGMLVVLGSGVAAQERGIPYVDVDAANAEIADVQADTDARNTQNTELEAENDQLLTEIQQDQQAIVEIEPILARVDAELTELFAVNRTIVDEVMKDRSQEAIGRARTIKVNLQNQIRALEREVDANRAQMAENRERIRINTRNIGENDERILFLEAAVRQTEAQQARLDGFITNVDSILSDAEQYVESEEAAAE